jgi:hypothetical protein
MMVLLNNLRASTFAALRAIRLPMLARGQQLAASSQPPTKKALPPDVAERPFEQIFYSPLTHLSTVIFTDFSKLNPGSGGLKLPVRRAMLAR